MTQLRKRLRLDQLLLEKHPEWSRAYAQSMIMQGLVTVNDVRETKAGTLVPPDAQIVVQIPQVQYVSRAGQKLAHALEQFKIDVTNLVALDAGISTGGFTDCLLQNGIARVYGVDVGYGIVHEKVRADARVVLMERTNLRYLDSLPELVDLVTLDLSFISVLKVLPAVVQLMKPQAELVILVKPQFEAERGQVGRGGIVRDTAVHEAVIAKVTHGVQGLGFAVKGVIPSPIAGGDGNTEFLLYAMRG